MAPKGFRELPFHQGYICEICDGRLPSNGQGLTVHREYHQRNNQYRDPVTEKVEIMSAVLWCDVGDHAFKAGVKGSQSVALTETEDDGSPVTRRMDSCPDHSFQVGRPDTTVAKPILG